jgi:hypothetical protein
MILCAHRLVSYARIAEADFADDPHESGGHVALGSGCQTACDSPPGVVPTLFRGPLAAAQSFLVSHAAGNLARAARWNPAAPHEPFVRPSRRRLAIRPAHCEPILRSTLLSSAAQGARVRVAWMTWTAPELNATIGVLAPLAFSCPSCDMIWQSPALDQLSDLLTLTGATRRLAPKREIDRDETAV